MREHIGGQGEGGMQLFLQDLLDDPTQDLDACLQSIQTAWDSLPAQ